MAALASPAMAEEITWNRVEPGCATRAVQTLDCGSFGEYLFGEAARASRCSSQAAGVSEPLLLAAEEDSDDPLGGRLYDWEPVESPPLKDSTGLVDFFSNHGSWVQHVARVASGDGGHAWISLLESSGITDIQRIGHVSDLHVLETVCGILEYPESRPKVLNMSFGRLLDAPPCSDANSIPCEISQLLTHMHDDLGMTLVAAAGNHGDLLFPASEPSTLAVGMLDTSAYAPEGNTVQPAAGTPEGYDALLPGNGLIVEVSSAQGPLQLPVPPGSSFSTALLSGWLSAWERADPGAIQKMEIARGDDTLSIAWGPDGGFYLAAGGRPFVNSRFVQIDALLNATFGIDTTGFDGRTYPDATYDLALSAAPSERLWPTSRQELMKETNLPNPGSEPCVPCRLRRRSTRASAPGLEEVVLEMATHALPDTIRLDDILLAVDSALYDLEGADYGAFVAGTAAADDVLVNLTLQGDLLDNNHRLSLVFFNTRLSDESAFYDEIVFTQHLDQRERLHSSNFEAGDFFWWTDTLGAGD